MKRLLVKILLGSNRKVEESFVIRGEVYDLSIKPLLCGAPELETKQIVNGMLYDTETATEIGIFKVGQDERYPEFPIWGDIYVTAKGNFFYKNCGGLHPITKDEAEEILQQDPDTYRKYFGEPKEA